MNKNLLRYIFQHKINIHPVYNPDEYELFKELFHLTDNEMTEINNFFDDIANHLLEKLEDWIKDRFYYMELFELEVNGINITVMKYSNKGIIILINDNKSFYRIKVTIINELKIEVLPE